MVVNIIISFVLSRVRVPEVTFTSYSPTSFVLLRSIFDTNQRCPYSPSPLRALVSASTVTIIVIVINTFSVQLIIKTNLRSLAVF